MFFQEGQLVEAAELLPKASLGLVRPLQRVSFLDGFQSKKYVGGRHKESLPFRRRKSAPRVNPSLAFVRSASIIGWLDVEHVLAKIALVDSYEFAGAVDCRRSAMSFVLSADCVVAMRNRSHFCQLGVLPM